LELALVLHILKRDIFFLFYLSTILKRKYFVCKECAIALYILGQNFFIIVSINMIIIIVMIVSIKKQIRSTKTLFLSGIYILDRIF